LPRERRKAWRHTGYCPQSDALVDALTGRELLIMMAELRAFPPALACRAASGLLHDLHLGRFADAPCGTYSGGNKRKLNLAMALISHPRVLLLDGLVGCN
jgi:ABC-type multidrug transport system ATPase subunit